MKKPLVIALFALAACKKDDTPVRQLNYDGKWYIHQTVDKQYTLENGDTAYTKFEVKDYPTPINYIDFETNLGKGAAFLYLGGKADSMGYEALTPTYFKLDSTLCEVTHLTDSAFQFNTLVFDHNVIPDRVQIRQFFFVLSR